MSKLRQTVGGFLVAVFAAGTLNTMYAQVVVLCPPYCTQKYLEAEYGEDWHLWYALHGCFLIPQCLGAEPTAAPRSQPVTAPRRFLVRG